MARRTPQRLGYLEVAEQWQYHCPPQFQIPKPPHSELELGHASPLHIARLGTCHTPHPYVGQGHVLFSLYIVGSGLGCFLAPFHMARWGLPCPFCSPISRLLLVSQDFQVLVKCPPEQGLGHDLELTGGTTVQVNSCHDFLLNSHFLLHSHAQRSSAPSSLTDSIPASLGLS